MSKPNDLASIFSLLNEEAIAEKNHFLFFLGTDTVFTPRPTLDKSYERGETLSYAAQVVVKMLGEEGQAEFGPIGDPLSYTSPSVDLINGPTTLGTEVGERVAQGVFLALRAIANGNERLEIASHSRGAVQAIMVMNELARIKKALLEQPNKSLYEILCEAPSADDNTNIAPAMQKLFKHPENETPELRAALLQKLTNVKINPFLMDPVPGGSKFGIKKIRWHSRRFYEKPSCDNHELILFRDERTCCFTPIVPEGMQPLVLPGHHGCASGNRYNQQGVEVDASITNRDTRTIQNLMLCKLFYFLNNNTGGRFAANLYKEIDLGHDQLDPIMRTFLQASDADRRNLILEHYIDVHKNDEAYRSFANGSYAWLGAQYTKDKNRYVHYRGHNHSSMSNVAPTFNEAFLNEEHALLYLRNFINFDDLQESSLPQMVSKVTTTLENSINALLSTAQSSAVDPEVVKLLQLLNDPEGAKLLFSSLSLLVDIISQKYLRNNLSQDEDERLRDVIDKPFQIIRNAQKQIKSMQGPQKEHIRQFAEIIGSSLQHTIETHFNSIVDQTDFLHKQIEFLLTVPDDFHKTFLHFANTSFNGDDKLEEIQEKLLETPAESIKSPGDMQDIIEGLAASCDAETKEIILSKTNEFLERYMEARATSAEDYLKNIQRLYKLSSTLVKDLPALRNLIPKREIAIRATDLNYRKAYLVEIAGILLKEQQFDLRTKPEYLSATFFHLIKQEAIKHGASSPEMEELHTDNRSLSLQLQDTKSELETQSSLVLSKEEQVNRLVDELKSKSRTIDEQKEKLTALSNELEQKDRTITQQQQEVERVNSELAEKEDTIKEQTSELEQKGQTIAQQQQDLENVRSDLAKKELTVNEKTRELEQRDRTITQQQQEVERVRSELAGKEDTIEEQASELEQKAQTITQQQQDLENVRSDLAKKELTVNEKTRELEQRDRTITQQQQEVERVRSELARKEDTVKEQTSELEQKGQTIAQQLLDLEDAGRDLAAKEQTINKQASGLEQRDRTINQQQSELARKDETILKQARELKRKRKAVASNNLSLQRIDGELESKDKLIGEQSKQLASLQSTINKGKAEQRAQSSSPRLAMRKLIAQLNSPQELAQAVLISDKLLPFTVEYQNELLESAQEYIPDLKPGKNGQLSATIKLDEDQKKEFDKIAYKYALLSNLKKHLEVTESNPLPSQRVQCFKSYLKKISEQLKAHRDGRFERFAKGCLAAIATVLSVFGIFGLMAYSSYTNKSLPFFFKYHSRGDNYVTNCGEALSDFEEEQRLTTAAASA